MAEELTEPEMKKENDVTEESDAAKEPESPQADVSGAEFESIEDAPQGPALSLDVVLDISMPVTVELGRTELTVKKLLQLRTGSVIELDKMAGEPLDIYIRDVCFARGEVVVVDNDFGVRITEILNPDQPLEELDKGES